MAFLDNPLYASAEIACRVLEDIYEAHRQGEDYLIGYMDSNADEVRQAMLDLTGQLMELEYRLGEWER